MIEKPSLRNLTSSNYGKPPKEPNEFLKSLGAPHVASFNYAVGEGLDLLVRHLLPLEFQVNDSIVRLSIGNVDILPPAAPFGSKTSKVYPTECRQRAGTYSGKVLADIQWSIDGVDQTPIQKDIGSIPIMLMSKLCHLSSLKPSELLERGEHADEWGGYFIVKGNEKLIRMLLLTRRNFPIAVKRPTWKQRGNLFSDIGVIIRSVSKDETSINNVLHFVTDGSAKVMIPFRKMLYYVPLFLLMKCLVNLSDEAIFKTIMDGHEDDLYMRECLLNMMRSLHKDGIHTHTDAKEFIGKIFGVRLSDVRYETDAELCDFLLDRCLLIHASKNEDKFNCLVLMTQKLFSLVSEKSLYEGVDAVMMQELMVGGYLYLQILKDKVENWLTQLKYTILKKATPGFILNYTEFNFCLKMTSSIEASFENFLSTGNVKSSANLVLPQDKGLVIIAENLNRMRYMAHFRAVHRGAFFKGMRTTEARMLLPDAWGFICPVHTPDGEPCGLLNHLAKECQVTTPIDAETVAKIPEVLASLGMMPFSSKVFGKNKDSYTVVLDGIVIGRLNKLIARRLVDKLRMLKIWGNKVPKTLEIVFVPTSENRGQFPGLYLFTGPARMMRPVYNIAAKQIELIGTFEQIYLDISLTQDEIHPGITTHHELSKTSFLSNLASLIPMPDCNQSPRNMYQCQMGKQTMGTPCHNWQYQSSTKLYRLQTPASPLFRPLHYDRINLDDFPMGTNAIVAVISYTGYDMEDAMVINKSALERGLAHASIFKTEFVELSSSNSYFGLDPSKPELKDYLGDDGLPYPGGKLSQDVPLYCYFDYDKSYYVVGKYTSSEPAVIDHVKLCSSSIKGRTVGLACISFRIPRNPTIGDKFASRAGQKGICSQTWPAEDLPFTESGLVPDIIFNPNSFPSRMTIAMMIECMAGKTAVLHGTVHDATPFEFSEDNTAIDYFGQLLRKGGYNYYGTERLYSGVNGCEMNADIFFGVVHYQRLRHMVSDKWQVRSTGPVDVLTRQPVKGRKRGGGVRFGEMERDSLISHGASFLLQDRLFHCSDKTTALVCRNCNTILGPIIATSTSEGDTIKNVIVKCRLCSDGGRIEKIEIPYIFRYLVSQLASININVKLQLTENNLINVC